MGREAEYRAWHRAGQTVHTRAGLWAALVGWMTATSVVWVSDPATAPRATLAIAAAMAVIAVALALTYAPRLARWVLPAAIIANTVSGIIGVLLGSWLTRHIEFALVIMVIAPFFPFAIFRLRPVHAAIAVAPYAVLEVVVVALRGDLDRVAYVVNLMTPLAVFAIGLFACHLADAVQRRAFAQEQLIEAQRAEIDRERERADVLLRNILPAPIAERLKRDPGVIAERFDAVTVLFADVVGFSSLSARLGPERLVELLNDVFSRFDRLAAAHGVEKIKTIGDAYMAVAGLAEPRADHAAAAADLALEMRTALAATAHGIRVRIGLCTGPAIAGVIGAHKFAYDLWGDTVNTAARMESHGVEDGIQVAEPTYLLLRSRYQLDERGVVEIKGMGPMRTWLLGGRLP